MFCYNQTDKSVLSAEIITELITAETANHGGVIAENVLLIVDLMDVQFLPFLTTQAFNMG